MSAWVFGSIAIEITGSGKCSDSSRIGLWKSQSVSPVRDDLEADDRRDVARADLVDLLALVRVHLEQAADPLLACRVAALITCSPGSTRPE